MPYLTRSEVREIDRRCMEEFHIPGIILMEHASLGVADAACEELLSITGKPSGNIVILCGSGNNGGDGLAAARHLHNRNIAVQIGLTIDPAKYRGDALIQWQIVQAMGLHIFTAAPDNVRNAQADLIIDAIFGTGLATPPREPFSQIVDAMEATRIAVLAVDLPSGLDCDTGQPLGNAIHAKRTITFVAEKAGFANPESKQFTGRVTTAGIGAPRGLTLGIGTIAPKI